VLQKNRSTPASFFVFQIDIYLTVPHSTTIDVIPRVLQSAANQNRSIAGGDRTMIHATATVGISYWTVKLRIIRLT